MDFFYNNQYYHTRWLVNNEEASLERIQTEIKIRTNEMVEVFFNGKLNNQNLILAAKCIGECQAYHDGSIIIEGGKFIFNVSCVVANTPYFLSSAGRKIFILTTITGTEHIMKTLNYFQRLAEDLSTCKSGCLLAYNIREDQLSELNQVIMRGRAGFEKAMNDYIESIQRSYTGKPVYY